MELNIFSHKLNFFIALLSLFVLKFYSVDLPKNFEKPFEYRKFNMIYKFVPTIIRIGGLIGYGNEPTVFRELVHYNIKRPIPEFPDIKKINRKINDVNVSIYSSISLNETDDVPILIYYHGGGFIIGLLEMSDHYLSQIAQKLNIVIISVGYRLAPEHPFPTPTDDCYKVTKYVLESKNEFGDTNKVILAGDSAGGNIAAVMTQRLKAENMRMPILQVLVYPWTQMFNFKTASNIKYKDPHNYGAKFMLWYFGLTNYNETEILAELIAENYHTLLINDKELIKKFISYTDSSLLPDKHKAEFEYYNNYDVNKQFPKSIDNDLLKSPKISGLLKKMFTVDVSPGLADLEELKGLPKALFVVGEVDALKDDSMIYAERLRSAGVEVEIVWFENGIHGVVDKVGEDGLQVARDMQKKVIDFIKNNI